MLVRSADTGAHVGPGVAPSFSAVYELVAGELRATYLFPAELFVRVFDGRTPSSLSPEEVMRALEPHIAVLADGQPLPPRIVSAWFTGPLEATTVASDTSSSGARPGFEHEDAPWALVQLKLARTLPPNFEKLRFRFAIEETYREHADDEALARDLEAHVFPLIAGETRHELLFRPNAPEIEFDRARLTSPAVGTGLPVPTRPRFELGLWARGLLLLALIALVLFGWPRVPARARPLLATIVIASATVIVVPWVRDSLVGISNRTTESESARFEGLLRGVYRSFDRTTESEIYDALAEVVEGPLLERLYRDVYRGLVRKEHDGALATVQRIELRSTVVEPGAPWSTVVWIRAEWEVDARVEHFGHRHDRRLLYRGRFQVAEAPDGRARFRSAEFEDQKVGGEVP